MVIVLFSITAISALLVALVNDMTKEAIALSQQEAKNAAKFKVVNTTPDEARVVQDTVCTISDFNITVSTIVRHSDNSVVGYAVEAPSITKSGYGDRITLMVGFIEQDDKTIINHVEVISQKETPGLGANMTVPGNVLEKSILGKNPQTLKFKVKKDDASGSFDSLTGSTISSRAYVNAVETAYAGYLKARGWLDEGDASSTPTGATATEEDDAKTGANAMSGATATEDRAANNDVKEE
jgi:electron transport complex protein RnfG